MICIRDARECITGLAGRDWVRSCVRRISDPHANPSPTPSSTPIPGGWTVAPQGDWVGAYGADGYALLAWNKTSDVIVVPSATVTLDQGRRYRWTSSTTSVRALEDATQTQRRAAQWLDNGSLRLHLTFSTAYCGTLRLYAIDWDGTKRRQVVVVDDGSVSRSVNLSSSFHGVRGWSFRSTWRPVAQ